MSPGTRKTKSKKDATVTGPIKALPHRQLQTVLETFTQLLEEEHGLVFGHNLGVQSGTAVIEGLKARHLFQLCSRAESLITMNDKCMNTFFSFCEGLAPMMRNRVLTAFAVFDKQELLDYVQLMKPELVEKARQEEALCRQEASLDHMLSPGRQPTPFERQPVVRMAEDQEWTSRVEALREAGHPFLQIVDDMIEEKHKRQQAAAAPSEEDAFILALRDGRITEELAVLMHRLLKGQKYLDVRSKWLSGVPLQRALLQSGTSGSLSRSSAAPTPPATAAHVNAV